MKTWREMAVGAGLKVINAEFFARPAAGGTVEEAAGRVREWQARIVGACFSLGFGCVVTAGTGALAAAELDVRDPERVEVVLKGAQVEVRVRALCADEDVEGVWVATKTGYAVGVGGVDGTDAWVVACDGAEIAGSVEVTAMGLNGGELDRVRALVAELGAVLAAPQWSLHGAVIGGTFVVTGVVIGE